MSVILALPALVLLVLLVLGGIALLVHLLCSPRTRAAGVVLLLLVVGVMVMGAFVALFRVKMHSSTPVAVNAERLEPPRNPDIALKITAHTTEDGKTKVEVTEAAGSPKLLPALAKALAKAIAETKKKKPVATPSLKAAEPKVKPKKPEWVEMPSGAVDGVYQTTVTVGPYTTRQECDQALAIELNKATDEYVEAYLGPKARGRVRLSPAFLREHVVKAEWEESIRASVGPMIQVHALLKFDGPAGTRLEEKWRDVTISDRLIHAGAGLLGVLATLLALFAYLKIDLATGGAYRGRLKLAAVAGILALVAGVVLLTA